MKRLRKFFSNWQFWQKAQLDSRDKVSEDKAFIERNIMRISLLILFIGTFLTFFMPFVMASFHFYNLSAPNEVGDAFGGVANPISSLIGVFLTFLAFYVQYRANERQTNELEKQKRLAEFRAIQESILNLKNDIQLMRYTKSKVTYSHSEAIWHFVMDHIIENANTETTQFDMPKQQYFQIAYMLTLFEPLINEIDESNLTELEKQHSLQNLEGLFEASFAFILRLEDKIVKEDKEKLINGYVKRKIIIPVKKIRMVLKEIASKYTASEKETLFSAVTKIKGGAFIKQVRYLNHRGTVTFFKNYDDYLKSSPSPILTQEEYVDYFTKDDQLTKILVTEPVRLLMKLEFLDEITFNLPFNGKSYYLTLEREATEEYIGMDLAELKIDKIMWRDRFLGKFVYDNQTRAKFIENFARVTGN
ncbi:MAG: hypothetical protein MUE85_20675 [Microscillaceae bacterium]|jgi:hypothetical protein|nr:hypothetical protein [Microscillaceae bacterium]